MNKVLSNNNPEYRVRHYCQRINVWTLRVKLEVHTIIPWQWGFTLHNNRSNICAIIEIIIEMEIFRKETLMRVKFHGIFLALRQSTIMVKFSYLKCLTNTLKILSKVVAYTVSALLSRNYCVSIKGETQGPCSNSLIVGLYST
jgi:hypothetical protein